MPGVTSISKLLDYAKLARIEHGVMASLAVVAGALSVQGLSQRISAVSLLPAVASVLLTEMSLFASNDVFNVEEDRINNPLRPIVSGRISIREAELFAAATGGLAILVAITVNVQCFLIILAALIMGNLYNYLLKKYAFFGNIIVSGLTSLTFPYGAISVAGSLTEKPLLFFVIAFLANLGREIAKGIRDLEGDMRAGVCTLPCEIGVECSGVIAGIFMLMAVLLSFYGVNYVSAKTVYAALISFTDALFIYAVFTLISRPSLKKAEVARKLTLPAMLVAIIAFTLP
ncbi:MAG: UbiA family prenyltransferase [Thermofilum sp.]|nr:UbiA family prenyltransferase [Thermofilum sp.]